MSKYQELGAFLKGRHETEVPMTFAEVEAVTGAKLPASAFKHRPWWSNNPNNSVLTRVWLAAGYRSERVDMAAERLVFVKNPSGKANPPSAGGTGRSYAVGNPPRHPALGAMKGTVRAAPGVDLTEPALGPDWEASFEAKWDALGFPRR